MIRTIFLYKNYFLNFYRAQDRREQQKIEFVLDLIRFEQKVPKKFFKALKSTNGIYEIRVKTVFKNIRIMCFFGDKNLLVLTNCFLKKTQKTPRKEIKLAEKLKKEYLINRYK